MAEDPQAWMKEGLGCEDCDACLEENCPCKGDGKACTDHCKCGCKNIKEKGKEIMEDSSSTESDSSSTESKSPVLPIVTASSAIITVPSKKARGCRCHGKRCQFTTCGCVKNRKGCSNKCKCGECLNPFGRPVTSGKNADIAFKMPIETASSAITTVPPKKAEGCTCYSNQCQSTTCGCVKSRKGCSNKCKCYECLNPFGRRVTSWKNADIGSSSTHIR